MGEAEAGTVDAALAERALAALVSIGATVQPGAPLRTDMERRFAEALLRSTDPAALARAVNAPPELLASLCIRVIRARR